LKVIHLLLHNIGGVANASYKKLRMLKGGETKLIVPEVMCQTTGKSLYIMPLIYLAWKYILCTPGSGYFIRHIYLTFQATTALKGEAIAP
jgi:hypothetical protein